MPARTRTFRRSATLVGALVTLAGLTACSDTPITQPPLGSDQPLAAKANANNGMFPLDIEYMDDQLCAASAFDVHTKLSGWVKVTSVQVRKDGSVRVVDVVPNSRITLSANGKSLTGVLGGSAQYEIDADGNLVQITFNGMNGVFTVPGVGKVAAETGRLVIGADGSVLFEAGPHDVFGSNPDVARLCAALAP